MKAAGIEPAPGGAKPLAESRSDASGCAWSPAHVSREGTANGHAANLPARAATAAAARPAPASRGHVRPARRAPDWRR
jgi:hypothetical protein